MHAIGQEASFPCPRAGRPSASADRFHLGAVRIRKHPQRGALNHDMPQTVGV